MVEFESSLSEGNQSNVANALIIYLDGTDWKLVIADVAYNIKDKPILYLSGGQQGKYNLFLGYHSV